MYLYIYVIIIFILFICSWTAEQLSDWEWLLNAEGEEILKSEPFQSTRNAIKFTNCGSKFSYIFLRKH